MPGRSLLKRTLVAAFAVAAAVIAVGCASADHSWQGEFEARLEGAATDVEEAREELGSDVSRKELFVNFGRLAENLFFKSG